VSRRRRRVDCRSPGPGRVAAWSLALLTLAGCTSRPGGSGSSGPSGGGTRPSAPSSPGGSATASGGAITLPPPATGAEAAPAVLRRLCRRPPAPELPRASAGPVPDVIHEVEGQVEQVRGLRFEHPVAVDAVTHQELVDGLDQSFDHSFPPGLFGRRSRAWETIGVIPAGSNVRDAIHAFLSSQVIGFYDPASKQLVFIGTTDPSPVERLTLAHELTHADDDQHFDLSRLNGMENRCADEVETGALGAIEGSAVFFSMRVAERFFSAADLGRLASAGGPPPPADLPPFVEALEIWPYVDGPSFIAALEARGGLDEVNGALTNLPVTTEQVMHPERYPSDRPTPVAVAAMPASAGDWRDLDVMDVGEEWVKEMLKLRLSSTQAGGAAAGWDGGEYRAWSRGDEVAVVLQTAWDTRDDAVEAAAAMQSWVEAGTDHAKVFLATGNQVVVAFGSDAPALDAALSVIGR
jgi:hypothetical protein